MGRDGKSKDRGAPGSEVAELERRLAEQAEVIEGLKARVAELEAAKKEAEHCREELKEAQEEEKAKMSDLIGCLDDCVSDPEELREMCACVRRKEDRS